MHGAGYVALEELQHVTYKALEDSRRCYRRSNASEEVGIVYEDAG
jgi:hypothetical protein